MAVGLGLGLGWVEKMPYPQNSNGEWKLKNLEGLKDLDGS